METRTDVGPSTSADPVPDHRPGVDDFVEPLLVDVAGLERGLLQFRQKVLQTEIPYRKRLLVTLDPAESSASPCAEVSKIAAASSSFGTRRHAVFKKLNAIGLAFYGVEGAWH